MGNYNQDVLKLLHMMNPQECKLVYEGYHCPNAVIELDSKMF